MLVIFQSWNKKKVKRVNNSFSKENSKRIRFDVNVPSEGEAVIRYTAHYSW